MVGEGEYNLNVLNKIEVTEAYLGLPQIVKECQDQEPFYNCTTNHYHDTIMKVCGCLPFNIRFSDKASNKYFVMCHELMHELY